MSESTTAQPAATKPITPGERARDSANFLFGVSVVLIGIGIALIFVNRVRTVIDATGAPTVKGSPTGVSWGEVFAGVGSLMILIPLIAWAVAMGIRIAGEERSTAPYTPKPSPWEDAAKS